MRNILTAVAAFVVSTLAAGLAALLIAEETHAQEEFILVFASIAPLGLIVAVPLLVASFRREPRGAVSRTARWLLVVFALLLAALFGYAFYTAQTGGAVVRDLPVLAGLSIPAVAILAVQWLIFRLRARAPAVLPMRFGRIGTQ